MIFSPLAAQPGGLRWIKLRAVAAGSRTCRPHAPGKQQYCGGNTFYYVVILTKFSSLTAPKFVIMTTFVTASNENFVKIIVYFLTLGYPQVLLDVICTVYCFISIFYFIYLSINSLITFLSHIKISSNDTL